MKVTQVFLAVLITYTCVLCTDGEVSNTTTTTTRTTTTTTTAPHVFTAQIGTSQPNNNPTWVNCFTGIFRGKNDTYLDMFCSAKDSYLSCLNEGLPRTSKLNGIDFALSLNFDFDISTRRLESLCSQYVGDGKQPECFDTTKDLMSCQMTMYSDFSAIFQTYQKGNTSLEDLRHQGCKSSNKWESCLFNTVSNCPHNVRKMVSAIAVVGFADKCNGGHNVNSLSGLFIGLLFVCAMFSRVWSDI